MSVISLGSKKKRTLVEAHTPPAAPVVGSNVLPLRGLCPWDDEKLTTYDCSNLPVYTRLIDGDEQGASLEEMARVVFEIDPVQNREWALRVVTSHLKRAYWVSEFLFPTYD